MKVALLGDIALLGQFDITSEAFIDKRISYLSDLLKNYDFVVANLETPLTNRTKSLVPKSMHLRACVRCVEVLKKLNVDAVTLANNHTNDFGRKGLEDTIHTLDAEGIKWYGIDGKFLQETIKGEKLSLSGFCCLSTNGTGYRQGKGKGINVLTRENMEEQIKCDKQIGATSIISVHYGTEHTNYPALEHIRLFDSISKENVVIIHGHHPHQIQGIKQRNNSLIAYSLGNAIFDKITSINGAFSVGLNEENRKSFVLGVEIEGGTIKGFDTKGFYISNDEGIVQYDILKEIKDLSVALLDLTDEEEYEKRRREQYQIALNSKFGKHDLNWVRSRFNYYSILARIGREINEKQYNRIKKFF